MSNNWQQTAIISPGGTVFDITYDTNGQLWLSTPAGIFYQNHETWKPLSHGQPLSQISALSCADTILFAGSGQGQIVYSADSGQSWFSSQVAQTSEPITCFAAMPNFRHKGTILAGTDGAGVLRSTDGGRNWQVTNFGLQDFSVIALATTPEWRRREVAFVATASGFYRSPNGGRAWKMVDLGMDSVAVQSIAVSPNYAQDRVVFVGTESKGIFRSTDGGKTWHAWGQGLIPAEAGAYDIQNELPTINGLWLHSEFATIPICVAGTGDGQIYYSTGGGATWARVATAEASVLCLGGTDQQLFAGLYDKGLLCSVDNGRTWTEESDLAARPITRLFSGAEQKLFAFGLLEGIWHSAEGGKAWSRLQGLAEHVPLLTVAASPQEDRPGSDQEYMPCLLAATQAGLFYTPDEGQSWKNVLQGEEILTICFSPRFTRDGQVWVGTGSGQVLTSLDGGQSWVTRAAPKAGIPLMVLAHLSLSPRAGGDTLTAVTFDPDKGQMTLWRSINGGSTWQQWQQASANWPVAHVDIAGGHAERVLVCLDRRCWCSTSTGWERVLETEQTILSLGRLAEGKGLIAVTSKQVLCSPDGVKWTTCNGGLSGQTLLDLAILPATKATDAGQVASILTTGGVLWQRRF